MPKALAQRLAPLAPYWRRAGLLLGAAIGAAYAFRCFLTFRPASPSLTVKLVESLDERPTSPRESVPGEDPKKEWEELAKEKGSDQCTAEELLSLHGGCVKPGSVVVVLLGKQWYWTVLLPQHYTFFDVLPNVCPEITYQSMADAPLTVLDQSAAVKLPQGCPVVFLIQNNEGPVQEFKLRRLNAPNTSPVMSYTLDHLASVGDELQPADKGTRFYALAFHELAQSDPERRSRQPANPPFAEAPGYNMERILHAEVSTEQAAWKVAEELRSVVPMGLVFDVVSAEEFAAFASSTRSS